MVILFISRYVTFVNVSMYIAVYMFVYYYFFLKHNGTHKVTQTNVAKERKMVKIVTKYVEEGRQVEKIEEHETIWIV